MWLVSVQSAVDGTQLVTSTNALAVRLSGDTVESIPFVLTSAQIAELNSLLSTKAKE
jgi:hypothetical protein